MLLEAEKPLGSLSQSAHRFPWNQTETGILKELGCQLEKAKAADRKYQVLATADARA